MDARTVAELAKVVDGIEGFLQDHARQSHCGLESHGRIKELPVKIPT